MKHFDKVAHILLLLGLVVAVASVYQARFDPGRQLAVLLLFVAFYLLWGVIYHQLRGDLTRKLFAEYLVLTAIALVVGFLVFGSRVG